MDKKQLRREIKRAIAALSEVEKSQQSSLVVAAVSDIVRERQPKVLALFSPLADEVDVSGLLSLEGCRIVLPRIEDAAAQSAQMEFYDYEPKASVVGAYGILEPTSQSLCRAEQIDMMVVPGVAFTERGERMGRGRGYYDRYLARDSFRAYCVGVCFGCQLLETIPVEPHDRLMDRVIKGRG